MAEYVDKALLAAEKLSKYMTVMEVNTKEHGKQTVVAVDDLQYLPATDVEKVKRAKWIKVYSNSKAVIYECSNCKHLALGTSDYCICGAKMIEECDG